MMYGQVLLAVCFLLVVHTTSALKFSEVELPCHRLPANVAPISYNLALRFPTLDGPKYSGDVAIEIAFARRKPGLGAKIGLGDKGFARLIKSLSDYGCPVSSDPDTIILHADPSLRIKDISVTTETRFRFTNQQRPREIVKLMRDSGKQMIAIRLANKLRVGRKGRLSISFEGDFRQDMRGIYVSTYNNGTEEFTHIVSQFQPTDARLVFPAFDEPRFRVPFNVSIAHLPGLTALGNTEVEYSARMIGDWLVTTKFESSPPMPIHMVAFTLGAFDEPLEMEVKSSITEKPYKVRVLTAPGLRETGRFALQVAGKSLEWFEKYIDFEFPLKKLDVVAIADHDKDNTETWGLVFIRDTLVFIDDETKPDTRITTAVNVAHVCVHQWFANLISAEWWTDMWITESVASRFSFQIVQELFFPESDYFIRLATLTSVIQADTKANLHPLSPQPNDLETSEQIYSIFDTLEFMKSASVSQMLSDRLSSMSISYQETLRTLLANRAYKTITFNDLVSALVTNKEAKLDKNRLDQVVTMLETFKAYNGVPLLDVSLDRAQSNVQLTLTEMDSASAAAGGNVGSKQSLLIYVPSVISNLEGWRCLNSDSLVKQIPGSLQSSVYLEHGIPKANQYLKLNPHPTIATYYRTRYSDELLRALKAPIELRTLSPMDRLHILDDANALVNTHLIKNDTFKEILDWYANEDHGAVLIEIMVALRTLSGLKTTDTSPSKAGNPILNLFQEYGFTATGHESLLQQRSRQVALKSLISQNNQQVIDAALEAFDKAEGNIALFLREPIYTAVGMKGSTEQLNQLFDKLSSTKSYEEKVRLATALSLSSDVETLGRVRDWLGSSGLKQTVIKPILDAIAEKI